MCGILQDTNNDATTCVRSSWSSTQDFATKPCNHHRHAKSRNGSMRSAFEAFELLQRERSYPLSRRYALLHFHSKRNTTRDVVALSPSLLADLLLLSLLAGLHFLLRPRCSRQALVELVFLLAELAMVVYMVPHRPNLGFRHRTHRILPTEPLAN